MLDIQKYSSINQGVLFAVYWILYVMLFSFIQGLPANDVMTSFINELISLPLRILFVHFVLAVLMDKLLFDNKIRLFSLVYLSLLLLFAFLQRVIDNVLILEYFLPHWKKESLLSEPPFLYNVIKLQFVATIPFSIKLFSYWAVEKSKVQTIESEKIQAELQFLRTQFHPHFLFNVLNSLFAKTLKHADGTSEIVLKISELLRYSLYEANEPRVKLSNEIAYLKNFIALQQIRFENRIDLSCTIDESSLKDEMIAPFLIIPFIENSFKHCMDDTLGSGWITLNISVKNNWLTLQLENSKNSVLSAPETTSVEVGGIGLSNVKRRLELIYKNAHKLKIENTESSYFVLLSIQLI